MTTQNEEERKVFFGAKNIRITDPRTILLDNLLTGLSEEERIAQITKALKENWSQDEKLIVLIEVLEKLFEKKEVDFQRTIREIYSYLPVSAEVGSEWNDPEQRNYRISIEGDAVPKLKLFILRKVIERWSSTARPKKYKYSDEEEAERCFAFLCQAYEATHREEPIRKGILKLFRDQFKGEFLSYNSEMVMAEYLDYWILHEDAPPKITEILLHAQIRIGGAQFSKKRIELVKGIGAQTT